MDLIDEEGRLFGAVNVVDALVVVFVVFVVVAGAALVFGDDPEPDPGPEPELASTHATLELGTQPDFIVGEINEGDTYSPDGDARLTITDVHLTPGTEGEGIRAIVRVELEAEETDGSIDYEGAPPRLGRTLSIVTDRYEIAGQIRAIGDDDALDRDEKTVVLRDRMAAADAREVAAGDEIRLAGRTVATIDDVAVYATANPDRRDVHLETTLVTHRGSDTLRFGGSPVRRGQTLTLPGDGYTVEGTIERIGGGLESDPSTTRTVTLRVAEIREEFAEAIQPGMTERVGGETIAEVTDVEIEPSLVLVGGENGTLGVFDHPVDRDVTLTTELQVRETVDGPRFKGQRLQQRESVTLDFGTITVRATVVSVR